MRFAATAKPIGIAEVREYAHLMFGKFFHHPNHCDPGRDRQQGWRTIESVGC